MRQVARHILRGQFCAYLQPNLRLNFARANFPKSLNFVKSARAFCAGKFSAARPVRNCRTLASNMPPRRATNFFELVLSLLQTKLTAKCRAFAQRNRRSTKQFEFCDFCACKSRRRAGMLLAKFQYCDQSPRQEYKPCFSPCRSSENTRFTRNAILSRHYTAVNCYVITDDNFIGADASPVVSITFNHISTTKPSFDVAPKYALKAA